MNTIIGLIVALVLVLGGSYALVQHNNSQSMMHEDAMMQATSTDTIMATSSDTMMATSSDSMMRASSTEGEMMSASTSVDAGMMAH